MKQLPTYRERYTTSAIPTLNERFGYKNPNAVPRIMKVVVASGVGRAARDPKELESVTSTLERITGQKPVLTTARKSIANFKLRTGMPIGVMVTLRGKRMEQFLMKLVHATLPRVRDFQGLSPDSFGKSGSYTIGFKEHLVFPEIASESVALLHGVAVTIVTNAKTSEEALMLLKALGFPFRDRS